MSRTEFPRRVRAEIWQRAGGRCEGMIDQQNGSQVRCNLRLQPGEGEIDHILADWVGGEATIENGRLLCRMCHKAKTAKDAAMIAKTKRVRDKHTGAIKGRKKAKLPGSKDSPWKAKIGGGWERR